MLGLRKRVLVQVHLNRMVENGRQAGISSMAESDAKEALRLWGFEHCGGDRWIGDSESIENLHPDEYSMFDLLRI